MTPRAWAGSLKSYRAASLGSEGTRQVGPGPLPTPREDPRLITRNSRDLPSSSSASDRLAILAWVSVGRSRSLTMASCAVRSAGSANIGGFARPTGRGYGEPDRRVLSRAAPHPPFATGVPKRRAGRTRPDALAAKLLRPHRESPAAHHAAGWQGPLVATGMSPA